MTGTAIVISVIAVGAFVALLATAVVGRHPDRQVSNSDQRSDSETYRLHGPPNDRPAGADTDIDADTPAAAEPTEPLERGRPADDR